MAVDVGAINIKIKAAEENLKKYDAAAKDMDNRMKRQMAEFQLVNQGLWQGKDHIQELEKELAAAKETFAKMTANKMGPIRKELSNLGQTAFNTAAMAKTLEGHLKTLYTELDKATGDQVKKSVAYTEIKKLQNSTDTCYTKLNAIRQEVEGVAKTPTL